MDETIAKLKIAGLAERAEQDYGLAREARQHGMG